jgi:hypothetical protein
MKMRLLNSFYEWLLFGVIAVFALLGVHVAVVLLFMPSNAKYLLQITPKEERYVNPVLSSKDSAISVNYVDTLSTPK